MLTRFSRVKPWNEWSAGVIITVNDDEWDEPVYYEPKNICRFTGKKVMRLCIARHGVDEIFPHFNEVTTSKKKIDTFSMWNVKILVCITNFTKDEKIEDYTPLLWVVFFEELESGSRKQTWCGVIVLTIEFLDIAMVKRGFRVERHVSNNLKERRMISHCQKTSSREQVVPECSQCMFRVLDHDVATLFPQFYSAKTPEEKKKRSIAYTYPLPSSILRFFSER